MVSLKLAHAFNGPFSKTTWVSWYQNLLKQQTVNGQWHQLSHMQVSTSLQTDNHASTPPLIFLQAGCPHCCPTNSIKALKANSLKLAVHENNKKVKRKQISCNWHRGR